MLGILPLGTKRSVASRRIPLKMPSPVLQEVGGSFAERETTLSVGQEGVPVRLAEVDEGVAEMVRKVHGEATAQLDYDGEVI